MTLSLEHGGSVAVGTEEKDKESYAYALHLVMSSVLPMSLQSAIELGVFDIVAKAGEKAKLSAADIAAQMTGNANPSAPGMLDRVLRLLASHSVLRCSVVGDERLYSLTPVSKHFVTDADGISLGHFMALIQDKALLNSWTEQKNSILEGGIPFIRVHGINPFEYPASNPAFNKVFNTAMLSHTTIIMKTILQVYTGFENLKNLVDVGGGIGVTLNFITSKYPHIKAINFDLPHVIKHAPIYQGIEHVSGDMFESVPNGDAILMKWILHDWSDEDCVKLLRNCHKATPEEGKVVVMEAILPAYPETSLAVKSTSELDVFLMTQCPGRERSREEFIALAVAAGFRGVRFDTFACNFWAMEFHK